MGLLNYIKGLFNRNKENRSIISDYYNKYIPLLARDYAYSAYEIPEVQLAVDFVCRQFQTIPMYHKRVDPKNDVATYINDQMTRVLTIKANPLQNSKQFWYSVITDLLMNGSVFIEPIFDSTAQLAYLYKLPMKYYQLTLDASGAYVQFFDSYKHPAERYNLNSIIYLNRFSNTAGGQKTNLGIYPQVIQAMEQQIINVANPKKVRALIQNKVTGGNLKDIDRAGKIEKLRTSFDDSVQGVAYVDSCNGITPINWTDSEVNKELMSYVINFVYNMFGLSDDIINNKATETMSANFIENTINPIAQQIESELTSKLFTPREIQVGNKIELDTMKKLTTTMAAKTVAAQMGLRSGVFSVDEIREWFGYAPLPDGIGAKPMVSLDMIPSDQLAAYKASESGMTAPPTSADNSSNIKDDSKSGNESEENKDGKQ